MKRVLRVLKLLMVLMSLGGLSSCINLLSCSKGEAVEEYDMIGELEYHSPWVYDDGNVSLSVSFEDTSEHKEIGISNRKRDELEVQLTVNYSNKTMKYSYNDKTYVLESYRKGSIKGHDIRKFQTAIGGAHFDIHVHYNDTKNITFEFSNYTLILDPVTKVKYPAPVPFPYPQPPYNLKSTK